MFRVPPRRAQLWFPDTGEIQSCLHAERVAGGVKLRLRLPPAGSVFAVFGATAAPTLPPTPPGARTDRAALEIPGPWEVRFPPNLGAPPSCVFEELVSWTTVADDGIKYFSGTATYLKQFDVEPAMLAHGDQLELDLGQLRNVAEATLNDQSLGIRWKPPFSYNVTGLVRPGQNTLSVKITNLWANRLAGDAQLPRDQRITRITQKVGLSGPLPAGLFGPVRLRVASHDGSASARPVPKSDGLETGE